MHWIEQSIHDFLAQPENNALSPDWSVQAFAPPLVGFGRGEDSLFEFIRQDIGSFYWSPVQAFAQQFPVLEPARLSVISWILPQTARTKAAHARETRLPSLDWTLVRHFGERINVALRRHVVATLAQRGIRAVAPLLCQSWSMEMSEKYGKASRWSERHTAHICGLGTFGLCDGLITARGKAHRTGSVVAEMDLEPTPRPYAHHQEYCLRHQGLDCRACMRRCPAKALSEKGHDKKRCEAYVHGRAAHFVRDRLLGFEVNACGLCQVDVPCQDRIPRPEDLQ